MEKTHQKMYVCKIITLSTLLLTLFLFTGCARTYEPTDDPAAREELARNIDRILTQDNFSGAIFIRQGEHIILNQAYGMADRENNIENTIHTPFGIASITKQFTGAAILLLEEQGKLDTSSTLDAFFPEHVGLGLENVTVADLLLMRGGFGNSLGDLMEILNSPEGLSQIAEELMDSLPEEDFELVLSTLAASGGDFHATFVEIQTLDSVRAFMMNYLETLYMSLWGGEVLPRFNYSNTDYWMLGRVIEEVSGMTYEEFMATNFFEPLGMVNSGFLGISESAHSYNIHGYIVPIMDIFAIPFATGGLVSSVYDLSIWLDSYFGGELFDIARLDEIHNNVYSHGWYFRTDTVWSHPGAFNPPNFVAFTTHDRESDTTIIILSAEDTTRLRNAMTRISQWTIDFRIP